MESLELEIAEWRSFVGQAPAVDGRDVEELEAHLRDQIADLNAAGLAADEAFLIAVKRMGRLDDLSREFARENSGTLWRQLVLSGGDGEHALINNVNGSLKDLEPGSYVLVCFVPDLASGVPHAYLGMYDVVTVGDGATPAA